MMEIRDEPFELVIHNDEGGVRASATYRKRVFDDEGKVISTAVRAVTLAELGENFPWGEFVPPATQKALAQVEEERARHAADIEARNEAHAAELAARGGEHAAKVQALIREHEARVLELTAEIEARDKQIATINETHAARIAELEQRITELEAAPQPVSEPVPEMPVEQRLMVAVQAWLDRTAQAHGFDNIVSAVSYQTSKIDLWARQGVAFMGWRDDVWASCIAIRNDVMDGSREAPSEAELFAELPQPNIPTE